MANFCKLVNYKNSIKAVLVNNTILKGMIDHEDQLRDNETSMLNMLVYNSKRIVVIHHYPKGVKTKVFDTSKIDQLSDLLKFIIENSISIENASIDMESKSHNGFYCEILPNETVYIYGFDYELNDGDGKHRRRW